MMSMGLLTISSPEFGHGLFGVRAEAGDHYLVDMANREGYILLAMDWRGMSRYDLLHTVKLLISSPELFEAMRDNMFQGFANKFALQHFAKGALFAEDWLTFTLPSSDTKLTVPAVPHPSFVFYGISQGGILGAGYTALSGKVGLIDRSIIVSAGTPFASVMTRSTDFTLFDQLFRINFFNDRHIRSALALVQLAWDPVEASGTLALPVNEPFPPVLMQAGLGDPTVAASSSESLARAFNATTLPGNPRPVFGLTTGNPSNKSATSPHATFTEILYQHEYASLPEDDYFPPWNDIHNCLRSDRAMGGQLVAFINTGAIEDPCAADIGCNRSFVDCT
jgi:cephalosporin-C deacetylase-like acetyl esterase